MKYQLIKPINKKYTPTEQILTNREIPLEEIPHYLHTTDRDINDYKLIGEDLMRTAALSLLTAIHSDKRVAIIIDSDCDGYTSAAILINYLNDLAPAWMEDHLTWHLHKGKEHGLSDCVQWILDSNCDIVIVPDGGSNDFQEHKKLKNAGIITIVFDHHDIQKLSKDATVINIQMTDYPNKELSGAGVIWQFCRYLDDLGGNHFANQYLDLVALGLTGDMQSLRSIETKHLINKGFRPENIKNPFILGMWEKNKFKLGDHITSWGAAFYIVPFVNAVVRSGTQQEKEIVFKSMLKAHANDTLLSTKRGHAIGEKETLITQALRICANVKNRQTRVQNEELAILETQIREQHLLDHKVLLFLLEPSDIDKNIAGLIANKYQSKYQRPCCVLIRSKDQYGYPCYQGSARGCDQVGISDFKDICFDTGDVLYAEGHPGAFGLGIDEDQVEDFIKDTDEALKDISTEPTYYVDYIYKGSNFKGSDILEIADMSNLWGKDVDEAKVAIEELKTTKQMITLMSPDKNPTIKIVLPNGVSLIKFGSSQEEYEDLQADGYVQMNIVGKCLANEWNGTVTPQISIEDYDITGKVKYYF